jgi:hypothetical protein
VCNPKIRAFLFDKHQETFAGIAANLNWFVSMFNTPVKMLVKKTV